MIYHVKLHLGSSSSTLFIVYWRKGRYRECWDISIDVLLCKMTVWSVWLVCLASSLSRISHFSEVGTRKHSARYITAKHTRLLTPYTIPLVKWREHFTLTWRPCQSSPLKPQLCLGSISRRSLVIIVVYFYWYTGVKWPGVSLKKVKLVFWVRLFHLRFWVCILSSDSYCFPES